MATQTVEFGWYPHPLDLVVGDITIGTLPDLNERVASLLRDGGADGDWLYAPPQQVYVMGHGETEKPYPSRVFGLPKTHALAHAAAGGPEHLDFLVWALSFFVGMRLTTTAMGFLDATPLKPGKLVDFVLPPRGIARAVALAERFWQTNKAYPVRARRWIAAVHALFIAQHPLALQFEQFIYLYGALDACFALTREFHLLPRGGVRHHHRVSWMCQLFNMPVPSWADGSAGSSPVSLIRNTTLHESLFMDAPLGFALHGVGTSQNLPVEMQALVCRFLVALLGDAGAAYVRFPVTTRMMHGWSP